MKKVKLFVFVLCGIAFSYVCAENENAQSLLNAKKVAFAQRLLHMNKAPRLRFLPQEARIIALRMLLAQRMLAQVSSEKKDGAKSAESIK